MAPLPRVIKLVASAFKIPEVKVVEPVLLIVTGVLNVIPPLVLFSTRLLKVVVEVQDLYDLKKIMASISRVGDVLNVFRSGEHKRLSMFRQRTKSKGEGKKKKSSNN